MTVLRWFAYLGLIELAALAAAFAAAWLRDRVGALDVTAEWTPDDEAAYRALTDEAAG